MQALNRNCFTPAVSTLYGSVKASNSDNLNNFSSKMNEFNALLDHLKKSTNIPTVTLTPHPSILALITDTDPNLDPTAPSDSPLDMNNFPTSEILQSDQILNSLQSTVNAWIRDISRLTSLTKTTPFPADAVEEISFWQALSSSLVLTSNALKGSPSTQLTISVLKQAKRFVTTTALENNTDLSVALDHATDVNSFLRDFPINDLLSADDLSSLAKTTTAMFQHYPKIRNSKNYDLYRLAKLLESTTVALKSRIIAILKLSDVMKVDFSAFEALNAELVALFSKWDTDYKKFTAFFIEQHKRRGRLTTGAAPDGVATTPLQLLKSLDLAHVPLQARLDDIRAFRADHENLLTVIKSVLSSSQLSSRSFNRSHDGDGDGNGDGDGQPMILQALRSSFDSVSQAPIFDVAPSGQSAFTAALKTYEESIDDIENQLAKLLHTKLDRAKSAEDMFKIFSKFNPLFVRPRIRSTIKKYQADLIKNVSSSVTTIQKKFLQKYELSSAAVFADLRDIPPVAGKIMWAKLMEKQLNLLMQRMESVLGKGWEQQVEGRQLKKTCSELKIKLDTEQFFRAWRKNWEKELTVSHNKERLSSYLISIQEHPEDSSALIAVCNYDAVKTDLFKEVRNLKLLGFDVPPMIQKMADDALLKYPHAMKLNAALHSYAHTRSLIDNQMNLAMLVKPQLAAVETVMAESFNLPNVSER